MEGPAKGDDCVAAGGDAGDLDRVFHRFGAGGHEDGFLREITRNDGVQTLGQTDVMFIGQHLMAGVREFRQLFGDRIHHLGVAMPGVDHCDASGEVDIAVALDVPNFGVERTVDVDLGLHAHTTGNRLIPALGNICVFHTGLPSGAPVALGLSDDN